MTFRNYYRWGFALAGVAALLVFNARKGPKAGQADLSSASSGLSRPVTAAEFARQLSAFDAGVQSSNFNISTCSSFLDQNFDQVASLKMSDFDLKDLIRHSNELLHQLFRVQIDLHEKLQDMAGKGQLDESGNERLQCLHGFRRAFRALRFLEDDIGEAYVGFPYDHTSKDVSMFAGGDGWLLWNPAFGKDGAKYIPRSGDLILSRGAATTSAAIARVADEPTQFSHLSIVYVDPKTKQAHTIEAHIEIGADAFDWQTYISGGNVRGVVFRLRHNSKLAAKAAKAIYETVVNYKKTHGGQRICYDFSMNMEDHSCLYCTEVVRWAFEKVGLQPTVPMFPSSIRKNKGPFLDAIGVTADTTFIPADIELDPRFDLVAEWRDYDRVHTTQQMDAVLTSMYKWMRLWDYRFYPDAYYNGEANLGYLLRRLPLFDRLVDKRFPLNMTKKTIATVQTLNDVVNSMTDYLRDQESRLDIYPQRLSYSEMLDELETLRLRDSFETKKTRRYPFYRPSLPAKYRFHKLFHPADWP